jgi:putative RNA 2'-phosphotransferase
MQDLSKFLCYILRHKPETIGLSLDEFGYAEVHELIDRINNHKEYSNVKLKDIERIVKEDKKTRYSLIGNKLRANQGHSIKVNLELEPQVPPEVLFHGTPVKSIEVIQNNGLKKMQRHHVHLSPDVDTARSVGNRRGHSYIIHIDTKVMYDDGIIFYESKNGVWLTDFVDPKYFINL